MMRLPQVVFFFLFCCSGLSAQFQGSQGDGFTESEIGPLRIDGIYIGIPYKGGSGDGSIVSGTQGFLDQNVPQFTFGGGSGDGFGSISKQAFLSFPEYDALFGGASGDGHGIKYEQVYMDNTPLVGMYSGSIGDGSSHGLSQGWLNQPGTLSLFDGGPGDGQDYAYTQSSMGQSLTGIYSGASGDGHADLSFNSILPIAICTPGSLVLVDVDAVGTMSGHNWENAFKRLSDAYKHAQYCPTEEFWVADGIYLPTTNSDRTISLKPQSGTVTFGGFSGIETTLEQRDLISNITVLSGNIGVPGSSEDNSFHVIDMTSVEGNTVMDGFLLIDGNANDSQGENSQGAGIFAKKGASDQHAIFRNVTIRNCNSVNPGAAIYLRKDNTNVRLEDTILEGNQTPGREAIFLEQDAILTFGKNNIIRY